MKKLKKKTEQSELTDAKKKKIGIGIGVVVVIALVVGLSSLSITPIDVSEDYDYMKFKIVDYSNSSLELNGTIEVYGFNTTGLEETALHTLDFSTFSLIDTIGNDTEFELGVNMTYWVRVQVDASYDTFDFIPSPGLTQINLLKRATSLAALMLSTDQLSTTLIATDQEDWTLFVNTLEDGEISTAVGIRSTYNMATEAYNRMFLNITLDQAADVDFISADDVVEVKAIGNSLILYFTGVTRGQSATGFSLIGVGEDYEVAAWNLGYFNAANGIHTDISSVVI